MGKFKDVIGDVKGILHRVAFFNSLLDGIILFVVLFFLLTLINLFPLVLATAFSFFYIVSRWVRKRRYYTVRLVEKKFPFLKDKLTTANDTIEDDNFVISKLRVEVRKRLSKVDASTFFNFGSVFFKTLMVMGIVFLLLFTTAIDFKLFDTERALSSLDIKIGKGDGIFSGFGGNKGDVSSGLEFNVPEEIDLTDIEDAEEKQFKREEFLSYEDLEAIGAQEYNDPITEEEKEVVKNYFDKINER